MQKSVGCWRHRRFEVKPSYGGCQPNLEMSFFSQRRNVRVMFLPPSPVFVAPAAGVGATDDPASA
ncbi:MAG: hypothetical protein EWM73_00563 [Nitrospira sp.]|jgi:hypothetical protein|nr:MAG: hypothetical protein EWM73_00563 [Nitrospira sp.]